MPECTHPADALTVNETRNAAPFPLNYGQRVVTCGKCGSVINRELIGASRR